MMIGLHSCVVRYECEESFTTLNVDIRNHQNLLDSMEQYVKGDLLEGANAYHCEKCNKKVLKLLFLAHCTYKARCVSECNVLCRDAPVLCLLL